MFFKSNKKMTSDVASTHSTSTMNSFKHLLHREKKTVTEAEKAAKLARLAKANRERFLNQQATFHYLTMK